MVVLEFLFWLALLGAIFSYFLYPPIVWALPVRRRGAQLEGVSSDELPVLTLIVTVHNEIERIGAKLADLANQDYPHDRLEVIVASDASSDGTDEQVQAWASRGVRLLRVEERRGKEYAQSRAIAAAEGEILVFSDVGTRMPADSLRNLVAHFADPQVGAVSSEDRFVGRDGALVGEGLYVRYEMGLRRLESQRGGLVGLSGSFFAARRRVCENWDDQSPSDFMVALNCAALGQVAVTAPDVLGHYTDLRDARGEYRRKMRTVLRGMTGLARHPRALDPRVSGGLFAFQLWGHKLMRWLVPWFLVLLLVSSLMLAPQGGIPAVVLGLQLLLYATVAIGTCSQRLRDAGYIRIPYFFFQVNLAISHATLLYIAGKRMTVWQPSQR